MTRPFLTQRASDTPFKARAGTEPETPHFREPGRIPDTRWVLLSMLVVMAISASGCNQPPEITQVGPYYIADSFVDFLQQDFTNRPGFAIYANETLAFKITAEDPNSDPITYSAGPLPHGAFFDPLKGYFEWTPTLLDIQEGIYYRELYVSAQDDLGGWDSLTVTLSVEPPPPPSPVGEEDEPVPIPATPPPEDR